MQPSEVLCGGGGGGGPSNAFTFGALKLNKMRGTALLTVSVAGSGTVMLSGSGVKTAKASALILGNVTLPVKPTGGLRAKLRKNGKANVKINVTFTPVDGSPNTQSERIKLRKGQ